MDPRLLARTEPDDLPVPGEANAVGLGVFEGERRDDQVFLLRG